MDRRVLTLIVAAGLAAALVAAILIARSGGSSNDSGPADTAGLTKPKVEVPDGPPPTTLEAKDLIEGSGAVAKRGDLVTVHYVGVDYQSGEEFDASWDRGQPFPFQLGGGQVIPGWDQGLVGMRVGGRRELIIPPDLAYGPAGSPPAIAPNATLIFVFDLLAVRKRA